MNTISLSGLSNEMLLGELQRLRLSLTMLANGSHPETWGVCISLALEWKSILVLFLKIGGVFMFSTSTQLMGMGPSYERFACGDPQHCVYI